MIVLFHLLKKVEKERISQEFLLKDSWIK